MVFFSLLPYTTIFDAIVAWAFGTTRGTTQETFLPPKARSFVFVPGTETSRFWGSELLETDDKVADFLHWNLFSEMNRSQWLCRLAFPQVRSDAQER